MFLLVVFCVTLIGYMSMAVPVEQSSVDLKQFFDHDNLESLAPTSDVQNSQDLENAVGSRIVGGSVAPPGQAPHMVALVVGHELKFCVCGGSLITNTHILTAAHCITSFIHWNGQLMDSFHGIVGTHTWNRGGVVVEFQSYRKHPAYHAETIKNDGGLLFLKNRLEFTEKVQAIQLDYSWVAGGVQSYVTGWGRLGLWGLLPYELQILYVSTIAGSRCAEAAAAPAWQIAGQWGRGLHVDPLLEICTYHSAGHGMCHGDSGSALVSVATGKQSGIASWVISCAGGAPDMFARVAAMKEFIESNVGNHQ